MPYRCYFCSLVTKRVAKFATEFIKNFAPFLPPICHEFVTDKQRITTKRHFLQENSLTIQPE
jgi:hypothetical protein